MSELTIITSIFGILGTSASIFFGFIAFRKKQREDVRQEAIYDATLNNDIIYIKSCVERVDQNIHILDDRYRNLVERIIKIESSIENIMS